MDGTEKEDTTCREGVNNRLQSITWECRGRCTRCFGHESSSSDRPSTVRRREGNEGRFRRYCWCCCLRARGKAAETVARLWRSAGVCSQAPEAEQGWQWRS